MAKEKKVTIRHYLNKRLKGEAIDGKTYYSPYTRVTFNRNNAVFFQNWAKHCDTSKYDCFDGKFTDESFTKFLKPPHYTDCVQKLNQTIVDLLRYEYELLEDDFSLVQFRNRFEFFTEDLSDFMMDYVYDKILEKARESLSRAELIKLKRDYKNIFNLMYPYNQLGKGIDDNIGKFLDSKTERLINAVGFITLWKKEDKFRPTIYDWYFGEGKEQ
ncbi:MAG: hypothetical protein AAF738_09330, partial [Bacteroidota bacterium]